jgi:hypothetical protein
MYSVGLLSIGLECFLEGCNAFDRVGIPMCRVEMHSTGLECLVEGWNSFVQSWNAF